MSAQAYPLHWPQGFPRAKQREAGKFKTSLAGALGNVEKSLKQFAADSGRKIEGIVLSSNVSLGQNRPTDPGIAAWFTWDGIQVCIAVDRYTSAEANLQAIHHIIEARRVELRHGTLALVRATFMGFKALPAPIQDSWRAVLQVDSGEVNVGAVESAYKRRRGETHPDRLGSPEEFDRVQKAWEQARQELGS